MARTNTAIRHGDKPLTVRGASVELGGLAPDVTLVELTAKGLIDTPLRSLRGRAVLLSVVPSIDTSTCHAQTKHLAAAIAEFGNDITACTVSLDLPFAQKRWAEHESCLQMRMLSDYKYRSFGEGFGVFIDSLALLTRAVFVIDREGIVRYVDYVDNISDEPNYAPLLDALSTVLRVG